MSVNVVGSDGSLHAVATLDLNNFLPNARRAQQAMGGITRELDRSALSTDNLLRKTTALIAGYASFTAGTNFLSDMVKVRGEFQQLGVALETMLGSKEKADKLQAEIVDLAAKTPLSLQDLTGGAKQLLAFGFEADQVTNTLKRMGDIAAGTGTDVSGLLLALGQVKTKGRLQSQELLQFAERGVPLISELAKQLGVADSQVLKLVENGKVGFPDVMKVVENLTDRGGKFFNLMAKQTDTLTGQLDKLSDAWDRMLNDIGKSNEGLFSDAISAAATLVENYRAVIDVLKVATIAYGSYRAALMLTAISVKLVERAQLQAALAGEAISRGQALQAARIVSLQDAWKSLGAAIRKVLPTLATTAALTAVAAAVYAVSQTTSTAALIEDSMNEIRSESIKKVSDEKVELDLLQKSLQSGALSREQEAGAIKKVRDALGDKVKSLSDEQIKLGEAKGIIDNHIRDLERWAKAEAALSKVKELSNQILDLEQNGVGALGKFEELGEELKSVFGAGDYSKVSWWDQMVYGSKIDEAIVGKKKDQVGAAIAAIKNKYGNDIDKLLSGSFTTGNTPPKTATEEDTKVLNQQNRLLEKKKDLIEAIQGLQRDADQSGMLKEQSAIDKTREKYDKLFAAIAEYNSKVEEFNKKHLSTPAQKIGQADLTALAASRDREISNETQKQQAEDYKEYLANQEKVFEQYEQSKIEIGEKSAKDLYKVQTKGFDNYLRFLGAELYRLQAAIQTGVASAGDKQMFEDVTDAIKNANEAKLAASAKFVEETLKQTISLREQQELINALYDAKEIAIASRKGTEGYGEALELLKQRREQELQDVQDNAERQKEIYQSLNQDVLLFTVERIDKELAKLDEFLKKADLPPALIESLKNFRNYLKQLKDETKKSPELTKFQERFSEIANNISQSTSAIHALSSGLANFSPELASTIDQLANFAQTSLGAIDAITQLQQGIQQLKNGGTAAGLAGGIASSIGVIANLIGGIGRDRQERLRNEEAAKQFQRDIYAGEQEINILYRERAREQVRINKLRIEGLQDESTLLQKQTEEIKAQYEAVFEELQNSTFQIMKEEFRPLDGGVVQVAESISLINKTWEEINELATRGQLSQDAQGKYELAKKLLEELGGLEKAQRQNDQETREALTGTTAESITDSIIEGFRNGSDAAKTFADNFEDLMRDAMLNSLKINVIKPEIDKFFLQMAEFAKSGEGIDLAEKEKLEETYASIIKLGKDRQEQLEKIMGVSLTNLEDPQNSLQGGIKASLSEETGSLIAGQFGGLRLTAQQQLRVAMQSLTQLDRIVVNTSFLKSVDTRLRNLEDNGIKLRS